MAIIYLVNTNGQYTDDMARAALAHYFTRWEEFPFGGFGVNLADPAGDMQRTAELCGKDTRKRAYHFIIAFPAGKQISIADLTCVMDNICAEIGSLYQVFYAIHTDKAHLHVHLMINAVSYVTQKKFRGNRESLHWVEKIIRNHLYALGERTTYLTFGNVPQGYMDFDG